MTEKLIYFDNAATGYPKPECVLNGTIRAFSKYGGNPGRSGHFLSTAASKAIYNCREEICNLLNFKNPERVVFTPNATYALNMAIKGLAQKDSHILISNFEHNSVIRPIYALAHNPDMHISYSMFDASHISEKTVLTNFKKSIKSNTKLAIITVASNICGKILPLEEISKICKEKNIILIADASQACGEIEIDFEKTGADVICSAGHKGLYGPTGTGFAVFSKNVEPKAITEGGNGLLSSLPTMGDELPEKLEAGTLNTFGICGLSEAIRFIRAQNINSIYEKNRELQRYITDGLLNIGAKIYGNYNHKTPIILFNIPDADSTQVSAFLDEKNICTRSGLHCAPTAHTALRTGESGAVRVSLGYANTFREADKFLSAISKFVKNK